MADHSRVTKPHKAVKTEVNFDVNVIAVSSGSLITRRPAEEQASGKETNIVKFSQRN